MWSTLQRRFNSVPYHLSGEKRKVWKNHLSPLQKAFCILCFIFTVYRFWGGLLWERPQFSLGSETLIPKKYNNNKDHDNIQHDLHWRSLKLVSCRCYDLWKLFDRSWQPWQITVVLSVVHWIWNINDILVSCTENISRFFCLFRGNKQWEL